MKLVGITAIGTYYVPWFPYGLAAVYHICDEIVVVNNGFDMSNPSKERYNTPLKMVNDDIRTLDVLGKIHNVTDVTIKDLKKPMELGWEFERRAYDPEKPWVDLRGLNLQMAHEHAFHEAKADAILKWDTDNVLYDGLEGLRNETQAQQFYQYEFKKDIFHLSDPLPTDPYNDAPYLYFPTGREWYYGGGGPMLYQERQRSNYKSAHLRQTNPPNISHDGAWMHFYGRAWYHTFTNEGLWGAELAAKAVKTAHEMMRAEGIPSRIKPPPVTVTSPKAYIESKMRR